MSLYFYLIYGICALVSQIKDKILLKKIALCIKKIRSEEGITLDAFYIDTGIHLARIEQGKTNLTITSLAKICNYFNVSLSEFFLLIDKIN